VHRLAPVHRHKVRYYVPGITFYDIIHDRLKSIVYTAGIQKLQKLLTSIALGVFFTTWLHASETKPPLIIEMSDPKVRITIPGMPAIDMAVHPMNEHKPYYRLRGNSGTTSVSIKTPQIDTAITPMSCATAVANVVLAQSTATREQMFLGRTDEKTFLIIYGLAMEKSVLLNTHIVSSDEALQCIEAHLSKISTSDSDIEPWFNGFGESKIETF